MNNEVEVEEMRSQLAELIKEGLSERLLWMVVVVVVVVGKLSFQFGMDYPKSYQFHYSFMNTASHRSDIGRGKGRGGDGDGRKREG